MATSSRLGKKKWYLHAESGTTVQVRTCACRCAHAPALLLEYNVHASALSLGPAENPPDPQQSTGLGDCRCSAGILGRSVGRPHHLAAFLGYSIGVVVVDGPPPAAIGGPRPH